MSITDSLKEDALANLLEIIDSIRPPKALILDRELSAAISLVVSFTTLKEHGVEHIFWLQQSLASIIDSSQFKSIIFITSTHPRSIAQVASYSRLLFNSAPLSARPELSLICAPVSPPSVKAILESHDILGNISLYDWPLYFLPIAHNQDAPVISLGLPSGGFKETYIDNIPSAVHSAAQAIQELQQKHGLISKILGKGKSAKLLADLLLYQREQRATELADKVLGPDNSSPSPQTLFDFTHGNTFIGSKIDSLIIIDRQCDLITPLLTQLTYHGLIDEFYKITDSGSVDLPAAVVNPPQPSSSGATSLSSEKKKAALVDALFGQIHNLNFAVVGQTLNNVARQLQADYEQRHEAKSVSEIKAFVGKLGGLQSVHQNLRFHTALAEDLMNKVQSDTFNTWLEVQQNLVAESLDTSTIHSLIDTLISRSSDLSMVLRLLCLESCVKGGFKEKDLNHFRHEILQTYGYEHLTTLEKLEAANLLFARSPDRPNTFSYLRKHLSLVVDQPNELENTSIIEETPSPTDISYTYSGYAPLSVRLVQSIIDKAAVFKQYRKRTQPGIPTTGWAGAEDILKYISGPTVEEVQRSEVNERESKLRRILTRNSPGNHKLTTLVLYMGGITYAEIAALQLLAKSSETHNLVIATTGIISGYKLMDLASAS